MVVRAGLFELVGTCGRNIELVGAILVHLFLLCKVFLHSLACYGTRSPGALTG
jgi:hypothetical protein